MIAVEVRSQDGVVGKQPEALAELIAATLLGDSDASDSSVAETGKLVREQQEIVEQDRPSWQEMATVEFETLDDEDLDWTEI